MTTPANDAAYAEFGEWLHGELVDASGGTDQTAWALGLIARAMERIQPHLRVATSFKVEMLYLRDFIAFTHPGPYIYLSRRVLEVCAVDEAIAFVLAHEAAHHELGHLDLFRGWSEKIPRVGPSLLVAVAFRLLERRIYGPDNELAADRRAMETCLAAGYDGKRCLALFDVMADESLNKGDIDGVFGTSDELHPDTADTWWVQGLKWLRFRQRGYVPVAQRRAILLEHLDSGH